MTDPFTTPAQLRAYDPVLIEAYQAVGRSVDDLPYTDDFGEIVQRVRSVDEHLTEREVFHRLHNLRKSGRLPRLGRGANAPFTLSEYEADELIRLVEREVGSLGARDQLPYTEGFERLYGDFQVSSKDANLTRYDVWRAIARLAK